MRYVALSIALCLLFTGCSNDNSGDDVFVLVPSSKSGITFSNKLNVDLDLNIFNYMYYYNGGGTGVGDLNNDGWTDIVFSSNLEEEQVYLNQGDLKFKNISDVTKIDGGANSWTNGVAVVDVNGDGLLDIYLSQVCTHRELDCTNKLYICTHIDENQIPHYEEKSAAYGLDFSGLSTQAGFFDYDLDGDLDLFLMNHSLHFNGTFGKKEDFLNTYHDESGDRLYRNDGETFTDVTRESGIHSSAIGYGLGLAFGDVNNDGYPDLYVGNDFHENDYLYINQKDGTFKDVLLEQIKHTSRFSMGVDIADVNNDGYQDIISLDMLPEDPYILKSSDGENALDIFNFKLGFGYGYQYSRNALQVNQGGDHFKEIGAYAGIEATDWSWTPLFFDFDMDGHKDLFISNGIPKRMNDLDYINYLSGDDLKYKIKFNDMAEQDLAALERIPEIKLHNKFYKGSAAMVFSDMKDQIGKHQLSYSNSAAYADFDNDGDYDLVCNNIDQKAFLYENKSENINSVKIVLKGPEKNKQAIGTRVMAYYPNMVQHFHYFPTRGFQSSMLNQILVPAQDLDSVRIIWPDRSSAMQTYNQEEIVFEYQELAPKQEVFSATTKLTVKNITDQLGIDFQHQENSFVEFNREPLIPFSTSAEGPALAVGDINNDGLEDVFIGSSKRKRNGLFLQRQDGSFEKTNLKGIDKDTIYEEIDAIFSDVDGDDDLDLLIATGGNEYRLNSEYTQPLLYRNENGFLKKDEEAFKGVNTTASCVRVEDMDGDGDVDVFFGGRATPWNYGEIPKSYLLENDGKGNFREVTESWLAELPNIGFVKDAEWIDFDQDGKQDLILALEWGTLTLLYNRGNKFEKAEISDKKGWWNDITIADFDGDGDWDVFAGNLGLNARLKASQQQPLRMYYNDFDDNGVKEQILTYYLAGREIPFNNMGELQKQIPLLKKKFLYAKDFAKASISELMGTEKMNSSVIFEADWLANTLFINQGDGSFEVADLPMEAQFTTYNTAIAIDVNGDDQLDILPGGNYHYCNVQMGRYDSENGSVLINKGDGTYLYMNFSEMAITGQVSQIKTIKINQATALLFAQNNEKLEAVIIE